MEFNFGNNYDPTKSDEENNTPFSFNPDNNDADTDKSDADNSSPFDWTPDQTTESEDSEQVEIFDDVLDNVDNAEAAPAVPDIPDSNQEETPDAADEVANDLFDSSVPEPAEEAEEADVFEEPVAEAEEADVVEEPVAEAEEADVFEEPAAEAEEADVVEEPAAEAEEADVVEEPAAEAEEAGLVQTDEFEQAAPVPAALDKKVRTPDGEQEYLLSELIDVETGEPLDLTSLIPEELLTAPVAETAGGFTLGAAQPTTGGFDMSAGSESTTPSKRKRPARPKTDKKKGGSIVGIIFGGLLAFILFPYVMALIEMTTGAQSNIPIPAPGIKSTYKYIPEWWPDWAMFVFPGRTTEATDNSADAAQPKANEPAAPADNAAPADDAAPADEEAPADDAVPADEEAPADNAAAADDGGFDPDAFLGNDGAENDAEPVDVLADDEPADEPAQPAEPGVVNAPVYTSADVSEAVAAVGTAFKAAKKIDDTVYSALNDMAEKSTFVDTSAVDDQLKDAMAKVRTAMGNFGTKPALASALAEKWAARAEDEADDAGVLFVGNLTEVSERDGYHVNTINIEGQDGVVEVVGLRKIKPAVGDKVVVCGKRIANPDKNLGAFTDNGLPVIWGGIVIKAENK